MEICMIFFISQQAAWVWTFTSWRNRSPLSSSRFSWLTELWAWIVVEKPQKNRGWRLELNSSPVDCLTFGSEISGTNSSRIYRVCKVERVWIDFDFQHVFDWFPIEEKPRLWHTFTFHTYSSHSPTPSRLVWEQFFISNEATLSCSIGVVVLGGSRHARETGENVLCATHTIKNANLFNPNILNMSHIDDYRFTKPSTKVMRGSLTAQLYKQIYEPLNRACTVITTMSWWLGETRDDRGGLRVTLMERKVKWNFDIKKQWFVMSPSLRLRHQLGGWLSTRGIRIMIFLTSKS